MWEKTTLGQCEDFARRKLHLIEHSRSFWNMRVMHVGCGPPRASANSVIQSESESSIMVSSAPAMLSRKVHLWMHNAHVPRQCIVARKSLLLGTQCTADLLLAAVVNRVLVPGEIVRTGEHSVAWLAGCGVNALTFVRTRLRVPL
jgi:hypothetical protein